MGNMGFGWTRQKMELMMPTAFERLDAERQKAEHDKNTKHLPSVSADQDLIQARIVIPEDHVLPDGLDDMGRYTKIRNDHEVWIDLPHPSVVRIQAHSLLNLQKATRAVHKLIHRMRLETEKSDECYFVQHQTRVSPDASIGLAIGHRPHVTGITSEEWPLEEAVQMLKTTFASKLSATTKTMQELSQYVNFRVMFGAITLNQKPEKIGQSVSYPEYKKLMRNLSRREPATMDTRMQTATHADQFIDILTHRDFNPDFDHDQVERNCTLVLKTNEADITMTILDAQGDNATLSPPQSVETGPIPQLNWVFTAPDMNLDWCIRADTLTSRLPIQREVSETASRISVARALDREATRHFQVPMFRANRVSVHDSPIKEVEMKQSVAIPYRATPYVVKVCVSRVWQGLKAPTHEVFWSVELCGINWDTALHNKTAGRSHENGEEDDLQMIWPGEGSLESRIGDFFECILQIQGLLERLK